MSTLELSLGMGGIFILSAILGLQLYLVYSIYINKQSHFLEMVKKQLYLVRKSDKSSSIKLKDLFDKIYVIALPTRKQSALNALKSFDIEPEIIHAILKEDLPSRKEMINKNIISPNYLYKNKGTVACHLSHLKAIKTFLESPSAENETAVIFEDDLQECQGKEFYVARLKHFAKELEKVKGNWDLLFLGHCWTHCMKIKFMTNQICKGGSPLCSHAYVLTRAGAKKIFGNTLPMKNHGDEIMKIMDQKGYLQTLTLMPPIFFQNRKQIGSTIGNDNDLGFCVEFSKFDFSLHVSVVIKCKESERHDQIVINRKENTIDHLKRYLLTGEIMVHYDENDLLLHKSEIPKKTKVSNDFVLLVNVQKEGTNPKIPSENEIRNGLKLLRENPNQVFTFGNDGSMFIRRQSHHSI